MYLVKCFVFFHVEIYIAEKKDTAMFFSYIAQDSSIVKLCFNICEYEQSLLPCIFGSARMLHRTVTLYASSEM